VRLPSDIVDEIREIMRGRVDLNVPLSRLTSFRIGGPADVVAEPSDSRDLARLLNYLRDRNVSRIFLGAGTNVLFHDAGFRGVVIRMTGIKGFEVQSNGSEHALIAVGAGTPLPSVIARTCASGWTGLEPLWGIPGSFGGAVMTNAGAGRVCTGDFLEKVRLLTLSGEELLMKRPDIRYGYRSMDFPGGTAVVEGTLRLPKGRADCIEADLQRARTRRRASQPYDRFSAGCVFKNPSRDRPAGAIIDRLGFKGMTVGEAEVSRVHANFIVNTGHASSSDVVELIERIRERVLEHEKIDLELEIRIVGEEACDV
jgi:UDP-N-acetylmuramate dehydrogenase